MRNASHPPCAGAGIGQASAIICGQRRWRRARSRARPAARAENAKPNENLLRRACPPLTGLARPTPRQAFIHTQVAPRPPMVSSIPRLWENDRPRGSHLATAGPPGAARAGCAICRAAAPEARPMRRRTRAAAPQSRRAVFNAHAPRLALATASPSPPSATSPPTCPARRRAPSPPPTSRGSRLLERLGLALRAAQAA